MITASQKIRLALFLIVGFTILFTVLALLIGSKLTEKRDFYYIIFEDTSVMGLQVGGSVLYRGIKIGRVEDIQINRNNVSDIVVSISITQNTPIKADNEAILVLVGITGLRHIELRGGTNESDFLKSGDIIPTGRTTFDALSDRADVLAHRIEIIMDNFIELTSRPNQEKIASTLHNIDNIVLETHDSLINTVTNVNEITSELAIASVVLTELLMRLDVILDQNKIGNIITNTETITTNIAAIDFEHINKTIQLTNESIQRTHTAISRIDTFVQRSTPDLNAIIEELRETLENLSEFSRIITEDPSILIRSRRHN